MGRLNWPKLRHRTQVGVTLNKVIETMSDAVEAESYGFAVSDSYFSC
jgi:hypothetical protein